jgi:uncharacterized protein YneF (UPF0154 family)
LIGGEIEKLLNFSINVLPVIKVTWNKEVKNMEVAVTILGIGVTLLAFIITYLAWKNGKIIKENTAIIINKMDEGFTQLGQKMDEGFKMIAQKIDEGFKRMDEGFRLIALLILAETPEEKKDIAKKILEDIGKK